MRILNKALSIKNLFLVTILPLPFIYIGFGWHIGLNYGRKGAILDPLWGITCGNENQVFWARFLKIS